MNPNLFVRLFVPVRPRPDGANGQAGTAYPVGPDLVLTSRHVVFPEDRDTEKPIEALWHARRDGPKDGWYQLDLEPVLSTPATLDAVILRCPRPPGLAGFAALSGHRPPARAGFRSRAFADVAKEGADRAPFGFQGTTLEMGDDEQAFAIDIDVSPADPSDWHGASGAPVFLAGSGDILGVIRCFPPKLAGRRLHAVPCWKLLDDPDLQAKLGLPARRAREADVIRDLKTILHASELARDMLYRHGGLFEAIGSSADEIAERLARLPDPEMTSDGIRKAYDRLANAPDAATDSRNRDARETLAKVVQYLVPFQCESHLVAQIRRMILSGGAVIAELPSVFATVAEIYMAAVEERPTEYVKRQSDSDHPPGTRARPAPPIGGIDDPADKFRAIRADLEGKFRPMGWGDLRTKIDDVMFECLVQGPIPNRAQAIREAAVELKVLSKSRRYYLAVRLPEDETARREFQSGLGELVHDYPSLVILKMTGDFETKLDERQRFGSFTQLLPKV
jgi:hypothetical protein